MTVISLVTANTINVVESIEQMTLPATEAITAGDAVRLDTSTGKFTKANGSTAAEARAYGVAVKTAAAGEPVTAIRHGVLEGHDVSGLAYDAKVFLSDTDGKLDTAAGTIQATVGRVIPGTATTLGTAYDKLLLVDMAPPQAPTLDTLAVANADGLTVNGVIVPQAIDVTFAMLANGSLADQAFFLANRAYQVTAIREVHSVAGNDAGSVNLQVTKDTGTEAPGAGANLLTNNTNAGFNLKGTANTVQTGTLTATTADLQLAAGDRLSVDFAGTLTTLAGVVVTVSLKAI